MSADSTTATKLRATSLACASSNNAFPSSESAAIARILSILIASCLAAGCISTLEPVVYRLERFDANTYHARGFEVPGPQCCEAARRALLSHGYLVQLPNLELVKGRKSFQPSGDIHVEIEFNVVCASDGAERSRVFVSAQQDRYAMSRTSGSASLGMGPLGSVSVPIRSSTGTLVKTASETIQEEDFYERFFALLVRELAQLTTDPSQDPAHAILPALVTSRPRAAPILSPPGEPLPSLEWKQ
jgi:hypothetical protein